MEAVYSKLAALETQYNEINEKLLSEEVLKNPVEMTKLSKESARLRQPVEAYAQLKDLDDRIAQGEEMMTESDPELKEMAKAELEECRPQREELLVHIQHLLIPRDPDDDHNVIMEIRGGVGGDEGNIFAGDLYRMYTRFAESKGWKVEVMEASPSEAGGFSQIVFSIKGKEVYRNLKFESGAHRVQRVPKTESQGRIQTSTATVLCSPEAEDTDIVIDPKDLTIETHRASGAGGQHINKTDSAVRIVHVPTGITVNCQEGRSQIENRETAMRVIKTRVYEELKRRQLEAEGKIRREKIGTGDRSEKIRTYNYPQNRITDHRIGFTITQLDRVMEGKLDDVIAALQADDEKKKLEAAGE
ncbi:MAG: peptide chain release factor 1 [Solobacterium sp.]|jgi:peptide chain release factor 1|nr:peptide chain release factor 1 [Solobacterium sp.]